MIQQCDLRRNIQIMPQAKIYMIQPYDQPSTSSTRQRNPDNDRRVATRVTKGGVVTSTVTTKDTGERKQMFGYTARHIITTMQMKSSPDACSHSQHEDGDRRLVHRRRLRARLRQQPRVHATTDHRRVAVAGIVTRRRRSAWRRKVFRFGKRPRCLVPTARRVFQRSMKSSSFHRRHWIRVCSTCLRVIVR